MSSLDFTFSVICFSETWCDDLNNFIYEWPNYTSGHQKRSDCKGRGVSVYIHNSFNFKTRADLCTNCRDIESLTLEIISEETRNTIVSVSCRPPYGHLEHVENFFQIQKSLTKMFKLQEISILTYSIIAAIKKCGTI